jgi:hypothetical protein
MASSSLKQQVWFAYGTHLNELIDCPQNTGFLLPYIFTYSCYEIYIYSYVCQFFILEVTSIVPSERSAGAFKLFFNVCRVSHQRLHRRCLSLMLMLMLRLSICVLLAAFRPNWGLNDVI